MAFFYNLFFFSVRNSWFIAFTIIFYGLFIRQDVRPTWHGHQVIMLFDHVSGRTETRRPNSKGFHFKYTYNCDRLLETVRSCSSVRFDFDTYSNRRLQRTIYSLYTIVNHLRFANLTIFGEKRTYVYRLTNFNKSNTSCPIEFSVISRV